MLQVDVLLTENQLAEQFLAAFEQRYLPEKFFYWFPLSVKAWLELCNPAGRDYRNFSRSYGLISNYAAEISRHCPRGTMEVVSLGSGQGDKDLVLLQAFRDAGSSPGYQAVDSSQALLELALRRAAEAGFAARGLKADLGERETPDRLAASADGPRLYLVLGNTLGVIDPLQFIELLRALLRPDDLVLLDGEIFQGLDTMAGYDNPVNRRFAFAPLETLGLVEGRDGVLAFECQADSRLKGLHQISKHFRAARGLEIPLAGRRVKIEPREKIAMSSSFKYSRETFREILCEAGGFLPLAEYLSDDKRFLMVLARPSAK
jgi:uncharacterized SAM-dependent methyltransferase